MDVEQLGEPATQIYDTTIKRLDSWETFVLQSLPVTAAAVNSEFVIAQFGHFLLASTMANRWRLSVFGFDGHGSNFETDEIILNLKPVPVSFPWNLLSDCVRQVEPISETWPYGALMLRDKVEEKVHAIYGSDDILHGVKSMARGMRSPARTIQIGDMTLDFGFAMGVGCPPAAFEGPDIQNDRDALMFLMFAAKSTSVACNEIAAKLCVFIVNLEEAACLAPRLTLAMRHKCAGVCNYFLRLCRLCALLFIRSFLFFIFKIFF